MTIEEWAAEMWRRGQVDRVNSCEGCSVRFACQHYSVLTGMVLPLCQVARVMFLEAGVVPVVTAPGERSNK